MPRLSSNWQSLQCSTWTDTHRGAGRNLVGCLSSKIPTRTSGLWPSCSLQHQQGKSDARSANQTGTAVYSLKDMSNTWLAGPTSRWYAVDGCICRAHNT